ncbi:hypothetical protein ACFL01_03155 [Planctomycetota bacterium]
MFLSIEERHTQRVQAGIDSDHPADPPAVGNICAGGQDAQRVGLLHGVRERRGPPQDRHLEELFDVFGGSVYLAIECGGLHPHGPAFRKQGRSLGDDSERLRVA